jgi:hypothetical protein
VERECLSLCDAYRHDRSPGGRRLWARFAATKLSSWKIGSKTVNPKASKLYVIGSGEGQQQ